MGSMEAYRAAVEAERARSEEVWNPGVGKHVKCGVLDVVI